MPSRSDGVRTLWRVERPDTGWKKTFKSQEACHRYIYGTFVNQCTAVVQIWQSSVLDDEGQRIWTLHMSIQLGS